MDVTTKQILAVKVTDEHSNDSKHLKGIVSECSRHGTITKVFADGAFDSRESFSHLNDQNIVLAIKVRRNSVPKSRGCYPRKIAVPLTACITTANIYDPQMYDILIEPLAGLVSHVAADSIYSGKELYDDSKKNGIVLVCPIRRHRHTKDKHLKRYYFYKSREGQKIIRKRGAIERRLIEQRTPLEYRPFQ